MDLAARRLGSPEADLERHQLLPPAQPRRSPRAISEAVKASPCSVFFTRFSCITDLHFARLASWRVTIASPRLVARHGDGGPVFLVEAAQAGIFVARNIPAAEPVSYEIQVIHP